MPQSSAARSKDVRHVMAPQRRRARIRCPLHFCTPAFLCRTSSHTPHTCLDGAVGNAPPVAGAATPAPPMATRQAQSAVSDRLEPLVGPSRPLRTHQCRTAVAATMPLAVDAAQQRRLYRLWPQQAALPAMHLHTPIRPPSPTWATAESRRTHVAHCAHIGERSGQAPVCPDRRCARGVNTDTILQPFRTVDLLLQRTVMNQQPWACGCRCGIIRPSSSRRPSSRPCRCSHRGIERHGSR
jgi:hypothetical protein